MNRGASRSARIREMWAPFYLARLARVLSSAALVGTLPEYAAKAGIGAALGPREIAEHRVNALYDERERVPIDLRHALGWWMDTHVPLLLSQVTTVSQMYREELAPEQCHAYPPCAASKAAHRLWVRPNKKQSASEVAAENMLRKGGPMPPSIRYIGAQLQRCAGIEGESERTARSMVLMHMLGLYVGRQKLLPPKKRLVLYNESTAALVSRVSGLGSRELYCLVATYLVWATRVHYPLWVFCYRAHGEYVRTVLGLGLEYDCGAHIDMTRHYMRWRRASTYESFVAALDIKKKLPVWVQNELSGIAELDKCAQVGALKKRLTTGCLRRAGLSEHAVECLTASASNKSAALRVLNRVKPKDKALLYVIMLSKGVRSELRVSMLSNDVGRAQELAAMRVHGEKTCFASVCVSCGTWRPKSRAISGLSKATSGVVVHLASNRVRCSACSADWSIMPVSLVGQIVFAKLRPAATAVSIVMCVRCAHAAHPVHYMGTMPYCTACFANQKREQERPGVCMVCQRAIKAPGGHVLPCTSVQHQRLILVAVCDRHAKEVRDIGPNRTVEGVQAIHATCRRATPIIGAVRMRRPPKRKR